MADKFPFQVSWLPDAKTTVRELLGAARSLVVRDELIQAIRTLHEQLQRSPRAVGNIYRVEGVIEKRFIVIESLRVDFSVDTQRHIVVVRICQALWRGNGKVPD